MLFGNATVFVESLGYLHSRSELGIAILAFGVALFVIASCSWMIRCQPEFIERFVIPLMFYTSFIIMFIGMIITGYEGLLYLGIL